MIRYNRVPRLIIFLLVSFSLLLSCNPPVIPETQPPETQPPRDNPGYLNLATWNIRILSDGSRDNSELEKIAAVIQRYDLVAVQEARDSTVLDRLLVILGPDWAYIASDPVGTTTVKEIYAYFYRTGLITSLGTPHVLNDPNDDFIREPFVGHFRAGSFDFTLINIHVLYGTVSERRLEIALLDDVIEYVDSYNGPENDVILLGDFNFSRDEAAWEITTHQAIIPSATKTTITEASSYDNFWINLEATTEYDSLIEVYKFDEVMFQNNDDAASLAVSDHRPVALSFLISLEDDDSEGHWNTTTGQNPFNEANTETSGEGSTE